MRSISVLIVGAGPAGLAAAIALARHGVDVLVVDRRAGPSELPRSTVVSTRTMELLRGWGLERAVLSGGDDVEWQMWSAPSLARAAEGRALPVGYPTRAQAAVLSPCAPACVPQDHLERVLSNHLRTLPTATLLRSTAATLVAGDPTTAEVEGVGRVCARYVLGADGVRGTVRAALGIAAPGAEDVMGGTSALFHAPLLWQLAGPHRYGIYWTTESGGILLPSGAGDRWKYGVSWGNGTPATAPDRLPELIERAVGVPGFAPRLERVGSFTASVRLAEHFRSGDAFLLGDAAHVSTPRGGTGLNTAFHDGFDLGWKLAWVLRGWADPALLDSYEAERRPVAEHNVARSADPQGSNRTVDEELHADLGGRIRHVWSEPGRSTLDLLGPGLTLLTAPGFQGSVLHNSSSALPNSSVLHNSGDGLDLTTSGGLHGSVLRGAPPVAVHRLGHMAATALGISPGGSLLLRPDGVPVGPAVLSYREDSGKVPLR